MSMAYRSLGWGVFIIGVRKKFKNKDFDWPEPEDKVSIADCLQPRDENYDPKALPGSANARANVEWGRVVLLKIAAVSFLEQQ